MFLRIYLNKFSNHLARLLFTVFFLSATPSLAETYYVSPSGDASWPLCTDINKPCSATTGLANAQAGDLVYFRGGVYMAPVTSSSGYIPAFRPAHSGISGNPITFKAYPDEIPFIDNSNNQGASQTVGGFGVYYQDYIVWNGFHTKAVADANNQSKAILLFHANHCTIKNCDVEGLATGNSNNSCIRADYVDYLTIENNRLYGAKGSDINSSGIMTYHAHNMVVRNNEIYNCETPIYDKTDGQYNKYYFNYIWDSPRGIHINIKWELCNDIEVYQNIFRGITETWAIEIVGAGEENGQSDGFKFYNNVIYGSLSGISTDQPGVSNAEIFNNIIEDTSTAFRIYSGTTSYYDNNSTTGNFVNSGGGSSPEDYKRTSYPTDGRGGAYASVMGAYITGNEIIGCVVGEPPSVVSLTPPSGFMLN